MKNIHLLPTDKPSRFFIDNKDEFHFREFFVPDTIQICKNYNIYITSDEEIKEGGYVLWENQIYKYEEFMKMKTPVYTDYFSIILTTDQDLIADGVQPIDDEFLEWFVNNPSCEFVEVEESTLLNTSRTYLGVDKYKIIIPQEKPKQEMLNLECKDCNSNLEVCTCTEDTLNMKQETLEEDLKFPLIIENGMDYLNLTTKIFNNGVKWQQERMYSEEKPDYEKIKQALVEMKKVPMTFVPDEKMYSEEDMMKAYYQGHKSGIGSEEALTFKKWFEQFKKK